MGIFDDTSRTHLAGCIHAFLKGKKNINWVMSFIQGYKPPKGTLLSIIQSEQDNSDKNRYDELINKCKEKMLL